MMKRHTQQIQHLQMDKEQRIIDARKFIQPGVLFTLKP